MYEILVLNSFSVSFHLLFIKSKEFNKLFFSISLSLNSTFFSSNKYESSIREDSPYSAISINSGRSFCSLSTFIKTLYKKLRIESIYTLHTDEAEEMVWRAKIYNDAYFRQLSAAYGTSFLNTKTNLYRMLYGLYDGEKNVYARPLTKMKQDIAKQLQ